MARGISTPDFTEGRGSPVTPNTTHGDFEEAFMSGYVRLARTMWLVTGNRFEGEDVAQEAMARTWEQLQAGRPIEDIIAYAYRSAFNLVHRRHQRRLAWLRRSTSLADVSMDPLESVAARHDVKRALLQLPLAQRECLVLTEWLGFTSEEVARVLDVDPGTVRTRVHRARASLRQALGGSDA